MTILKMQRQRIDLLEQEYDELYEKYQRALKQDFLPSSNQSAIEGFSMTQQSDDPENQVKLVDYENKIKVLEDQQDELTRTYGMQFAKMKTQMTEQNA